MQTVVKCVVCEGPIAKRNRGVVSPFVAERIWDRKAFPVSLDTCGNCGRNVMKCYGS